MPAAAVAAALLHGLAGCARIAPPAPPPLALSQLAISVASLARSVEWYRDNLGFTVEDQRAFPDYHLSIAMLARDRIRLELVQLDGSRSPTELIPGFDNPALLHGVGKVGFRVDDVDRWAAQLTRRGVRFQVAPSTDTARGERSFIVLDPDGTWLELTGRARAMR